MEETKWWLDSETIKSALVTYIPAIFLVLGLFGVKVTDGEAGSFVSGIVGIVGMVASTKAIIGRFKVSKQIVLKKPE